MSADAPPKKTGAHEDEGEAGNLPPAGHTEKSETRSRGGAAPPLPRGEIDGSLGVRGPRAARREGPRGRDVGHVRHLWLPFVVVLVVFLIEVELVEVLLIEILVVFLIEIVVAGFGLIV